MRNSDPKDLYQNVEKPIGFVMGVIIFSTMLINFGMTMGCWVWWLKSPPDPWFAPFSLMLCQWVICYAVGYKEMFSSGFRKTFYLSWLSPTILSTMGILLGMTR
jgi:hypothetical protein